MAKSQLPYLVMPYIKGENLHTLLQRDGPLQSYQTFPYIKQAAQALDDVHSLGVVHRDIKPGNFLLATDGSLVLTDFGAARTPGSTLTQESGLVWTTEPYAAPEVKRSEDIDHRADIYSLGVVLREMVTGNPLPERSVMSPTIPSEVDVVIRKATAERPEDRYQSAGALAEALRGAIEKEHKEITVPSPPRNVHALDKPRENLPPTPAPQPATPSRPKLSRFRFVGIVLGISLLIGGIILTLLARVGFIPLPRPPTDTPTQQASITVLQYYGYWNKGDYPTAYNLLDTDYQKGHSYTELLPYYEHTHHSCITINNITPRPDGTFQVAITDIAIEDDPSGTAINVYTLDYIVKQEQGSWKLTPENLRNQHTQGICQAS